MLLLNLMDPSFENKDAAEGIGFKAFTTCWTRVHHDNDDHSVWKLLKKSHFDNFSSYFHDLDDLPPLFGLFQQVGVKICGEKSHQNEGKNPNKTG